MAEGTSGQSGRRAERARGRAPGCAWGGLSPPRLRRAHGACRRAKQGQRARGTPDTEQEGWSPVTGTGEPSKAFPMPPHKSHRSEGFHPALEVCGEPKDSRVTAKLGHMWGQTRLTGRPMRGWAGKRRITSFPAPLAFSRSHLGMAQRQRAQLGV